MITETEAYVGAHDLAAHSSKGRTARTEVLFGPAGMWYVYFVYGMHEMLNVVTQKDGAAVLIRGVEGYDGPAKLTKYLKIDRSLNKKTATKQSGLWVEDRGVAIKNSEIKRTSRVGVDYAGPLWSHKPLRFVLIKADLTARLAGAAVSRRTRQAFSAGARLRSRTVRER